jgi:hypothetical protein
MIHVKNQHSLLTKPDPLRAQGDTCGVRTQSYDCPPHIKYVKLLLYVLSGSGMSMKWMRGPYHYIIATFEIKTETASSSEAATCRVMVWYGVAPLWPSTTYKACQTPFICMK